MANTRFGNFSELSQGKKPMTAEEAWIMLNKLGLLSQEFIPGAVSIRKVFEGKPREAVEELQDWIPGNAAYQNFIRGKDQDWVRNALDLAVVGKPLAKGVKKAMEAIERMPKGGKEGFIRYKRIPNNSRMVELGDQFKNDLLSQAPDGYHLSDTKKHISSTLRENGIISKPKNWETLGTEERARWITKNLSEHNTWDNVFPANGHELYFKSHPEFLDAQDYAEFVNYLEHRPQLQMELFTAKYGDETSKFINGGKPTYSEKPTVNMSDLSTSTERLIGDPNAEIIEEYPSQAELLLEKQKRKQLLDQQKAERKAREQAEKEARWKAEREAQAKLAEEKRLAKEAEERRLVEEAEQKQLAEEAERKAQEEEFERQFREEEAYERNRYADSVGTALGRETVDRDIDNWLFDKLVEAENKPKPITTTQVEDMSTGIIPLNNEVVSKGGHRNTYDHSRTFMDTDLKQVPGIDRTGMSYGDNTDAFYDLYRAWRNNPGREVPAILYDVVKEAQTRPSKTSKITYDPYYNAGVVGDLNNKLWKRINSLRGRGYSDEKIRTVLKKELDEYQGKLERFKARMPSSHNGAQFDYDGARTTSFHALPSEEARALKALGIDTPEYDELERLGNFYRVFFPK